MSNPSNAPVLDGSVIERLRSSEESGDPALVEELVRDFGQITPHRLVHLRELARGMDFTAISTEARALADTGQTLGLEQMRLACRELAFVAEDGDADRLVAALVKVERKFLEAHEALESLDIASASP